MKKTPRDYAFHFRRKVLRLHGLRCAICGFEPEKPPAPQAQKLGSGFRIPAPAQKRSEVLLFVDHIKPLWAGGANDPSNAQVLCRNCHRKKTTAEATERSNLEQERDCRTVMELLLDFPFYGEASLNDLKFYSGLSENRTRVCLREPAKRGLVAKNPKSKIWKAIKLSGE